MFGDNKKLEAIRDELYARILPLEVKVKDLENKDHNTDPKPLLAEIDVLKASNSGLRVEIDSLSSRLAKLEAKKKKSSAASET